MQKGGRCLFGESDVWLYVKTAVLGVAMTIKLLGAIKAQLAVVALDGQDVWLERRVDGEGGNGSSAGLDGRVDDERGVLDLCLLDSRLGP